MSKSSNVLDLIYAALDEGKYDAALQMCLKPEVATFSLTKALSSYCYAMLKQHSKALDIARKVMQTGPVEDIVLNTLSYTFKRCNAEDELAKCYENALALKPTRVDLMTDLFNCCARMQDAKKMQQIAQRLYKQTDDKNYLFWFVACMLHQDNLPPTMLVVAQKTAHKILYDLAGSTPETRLQPGAEEITLYLLLLLKTNNASEATKALHDFKQRPLAPLLHDDKDFHSRVNVVTMHALQLHLTELDLLVRQCDWRQLHASLREYLLLYPDQWNMHSLLTDLVVAAAVAVINTTSTSSSDHICSTSDDSSSAVGMKKASTADDTATFPKIDYRYEDLHIDSTVALELISSASASTDQSISDMTSIVKSTLKVDESVLRFLTAQHALLLQLQQQHPRLRGPFLAELYLLTSWLTEALRALYGGWNSDGARKNSCRGVTLAQFNQLLPPVLFNSSRHDNVFSVLQHLIQLYYSHFQSKQCSFSDIKPYLHAWQQSAVLLSRIADIDQQSCVAAFVTAVQQLLQWADAESTVVHNALLNAMQAPAVELKSSGAAATNAAIDVSGVEDDDIDTKEATNPITTDHNIASTSTSATTNSKNKKKKKKNKKATTTALYPLPDGSEITNQYNTVLLKLCEYAKLQQLQCYCNGLLKEFSTDVEHTTNASITDCNAMRQRVAIYELTHNVTVNGLGGARDVQPGDELLLLNSSHFRAHYTQLQYRHHLQRQQQQQLLGEKTVVHLLQWLQCLLYGTECSPHCYGFQLDLLDPMRELAMGEAAAGAYSAMGVKHIQHDSMSYLLLPALLEAGMHAEALKQHRIVLNFHSVCKKETLETIGQSFKYSNYAKGLELKRFLQRCQLSLQLALSRAELPLLEVLQKSSSLADVKTYLTHVFTPGRLTESQTVLDLTAVQRLKCNCDFDLLVRADSTNCIYSNENDKTIDGLQVTSSTSLHEKHARKRREQMQQRLLLSQQLLWTLHCFFRDDHAAVDQCICRLREILALPPVDKLDSTNGDADGASAGGDYLQWDQDTIMAGSGGVAYDEFGRSLWRCVLQSFELLNLMAKLTQPGICDNNSSSSSSSSGTKSDGATDAIIQQVYQSLRGVLATFGAMFDLLITPKNSGNNNISSTHNSNGNDKKIVTITSNKQGSDNGKPTLFDFAVPTVSVDAAHSCLLQPRVLKRLALVARTVACWLPLMLQHVGSSATINVMVRSDAPTAVGASSIGSTLAADDSVTVTDEDVTAGMVTASNASTSIGSISVNSSDKKLVADTKELSRLQHEISLLSRTTKTSSSATGTVVVGYSMLRMTLLMLMSKLSSELKTRSVLQFLPQSEPPNSKGGSTTVTKKGKPRNTSAGSGSDGGAKTTGNIVANAVNVEDVVHEQAVSLVKKLLRGVDSDDADILDLKDIALSDISVTNTKTAVDTINAHSNNNSNYDGAFLKAVTCLLSSQKVSCERLAAVFDNVHACC